MHGVLHAHSGQEGLAGARGPKEQHSTAGLAGPCEEVGDALGVDDRLLQGGLGCLQPRHITPLHRTTCHLKSCLPPTYNSKLASVLRQKRPPTRRTEAESPGQGGGESRTDIQWRGEQDSKVRRHEKSVWAAAHLDSGGTSVDGSLQVCT